MKAGDSVQSKQRAHLPPVNASLFQDKPPAEKVAKESSGVGAGWGDWSSDVTAPHGQVATPLSFLDTHLFNVSFSFSENHQTYCSTI